jgi:hypothetical protein|tara:strand:- start:929 stop:1180 length:252 start_codon:yes stop_codon:yes gene_type:complete
MNKIETKWTELAKDNLVGCQILKVQYMSEKETDTMGWHKSPLCMLMSKPNGEQFWMYSSRDDEGNDGGALFTTIEDYDTIPTL